MGRICFQLRLRWMRLSYTNKGFYMVSKMVYLLSLQFANPLGYIPDFMRHRNVQHIIHRFLNLLRCVNSVGYYLAIRISGYMIKNSISIRAFKFEIKFLNCMAVKIDIKLLDCYNIIFLSIVFTFFFIWHLLRIRGFYGVLTYNLQMLKNLI